MLDEQARERAHEGEISRPRPVGRPAAVVDSPDDLRVDSNPCAEREAPVVDPAGGDPAEAIRLQRICQLLGRPYRVARQAERARQNARAASRDEAERQVVSLDAVQGLVEAAVAGEDDHGIRVAGLTGELDRVSRPLGPHRAHVGDRASAPARRLRSPPR